MSLISLIPTWMRSRRPRAAGATGQSPGLPATDASGFDGPRRLLDRSEVQGADWRKGADEYPSRLSDESTTWLMQKPFDSNKGNPYTCKSLYSILNILQYLKLSPGSKIIEVGSGPGWLTEFLLELGYKVHAIEPSREMVQIAKERISRSEIKYGMSLSENAAFSLSTLEEIDDAEAASVHGHAVLFFESLHHLIDEDAGLKRAFDMLVDGGYLVVAGEGRWIPGDVELESALKKEMAEFGTLENPFSQEYLKHVLTKIGFSEIEFYHAVNGLFFRRDEKISIHEAARRQGAAIENNNTLIARKPEVHPHISQHAELTSSHIELLAKSAFSDGQLKLEIRLTNTGVTNWPSNPAVPGCVTIALLEDRPAHKEANRIRLPADLSPGGVAQMTCQFDVRNMVPPFKMTLVSEGCFWFNASESLSI